jgi:hypothetical protein
VRFGSRHWMKKALHLLRNQEDPPLHGGNLIEATVQPKTLVEATTNESLPERNQQLLLTNEHFVLE